jgi:Holliday junction resolvasome RuvABC endonuclease subunit
MEKKKIKITQIEKKINKQLKQQCLVIGFDVASKHTGIAIIKTHKATLEIIKLHKIDYNLESTVKKDLIKAMECFIGELNNFISGLNLGRDYKIFVIEDCFLKFNVNVLKELARFSVLIWRELKHLADKIYFVLPTTARSQIGFKKDKKCPKKIKEQVLDYVNNLFSLKLKDKDLSDAVVLALSGLIKWEE